MSLSPGRQQAVQLLLFSNFAQVILRGRHLGLLGAGAGAGAGTGAGADGGTVLGAGGGLG